MNESPFSPNRRLLLQRSAAIALVASTRVSAQSEETVTKQRDISPVMRAVSTYIVEAGQNPLPDAAAEATRHHLLDTFAAMVSGSRLLPGQKAIAYVKSLGGVPEAC